MNRQRMMGGLLLLAVTLSLVPSIVATAEPASATVEAYIWEVLDAGEKATVLVILKEQADLEGTRALQSKEEKGTYVYQKLVETAENTQGPLRAYLDKLGVDYKAYWIRNMIMLDVDANLLGALSRRPEVERIEYYYPAIPDPVTTEELSKPIPEAVEWNILRVNADDVWNTLGITGTGAVVADLDTGVQWDHPALINAYRPQIPGAPGRHDYNWWDGPSGSPTPMDYDTHGTHTMGTIVGDDGGSNQIGMAPGAHWIACAGLGSSATPLDCFQFFLAPTQLDGSNPRPDLAPHVINNSWSSQTDYRDVIHTLYLAGIYYAKSAGNEGSGCSTITNPGQWPEVTATASFAQGDTISSFSSRGPEVVDRETVVKPDIAAPGSGVRSSLPGGNYGNLSGTSMACPHVTGAVALLISARPELAGQIDTMQHLLKSTAEPVISAQCPPFVDHPNDVWGWGILNIYDAVVAAQAMGMGNLEGTIYDQASATPLEGVQIDLQEDGTPWTWIPQHTGASGAYSYTLPAATYNITATLYGYLPEAATVVVPDGVTITRDLSLTVAPYWVISGTILEEGTLAPLAGSVTLENTPVVIHSDPASGYYSDTVAQGSYWTLVRSPGHAGQDVYMDYYGDQTANWLMTPIYNYYMRTSDEPCGPAYSWIDASDGDIHNLGDDAYVYLSLGRSFTFYGNDYTSLYIGSNGILTFGSGWNKWSGPIPDPALPNNGIYAFATDLNPANGAQGMIYSKWISDVLVIEFNQVEHYPDGDPETFQFVLDFNSGSITLQYQTVSDSGECVAGVENSTGTEATQYAYADPLHPHDNLAVAFYPMFSTPPGAQGPGELAGTVTTLGSGDPIPGAVVSALAYGGWNTFSATTDINGDYSLPLCADYYTVSASAAGYAPSDEFFANIASGTVTLQDFALEEQITAVTLAYHDLEDVVGMSETLYVAGDFNGWDALATPLNTNDDASMFSVTLELLPTSMPFEYKYIVYTDTVPSGPANWNWLQSNNRSAPFVTQTTTLDDYRFIEPGYVVLQWPAATTTTEGMATENIYGRIWADDLTSRAGAPRAVLAEVGYGTDADPATWADWEAMMWGSQQDNNDEFYGVMTPTMAGVYSYVVRFNANWGLGNPHDMWSYGDTDGVHPGDPFEIENAGVLTVLEEVVCDPVGLITYSYSADLCTVDFTAEVTGTAPFTWLWEFGDNVTSTEAMPTHVYTATGAYTATLHVWNCGGAGHVMQEIPVTVNCEVTYSIYLPLVFKAYGP